MLINLSNHPFLHWDESQRSASEKYGKCIDLTFPSIDPFGDEKYIDSISEDYLLKILKLKTENDEEIVVHLMGEMTFVFSLLEKLKKEGIRCIASTTERLIEYYDEGVKKTQFSFVRFRDYFNIAK
jgi:hypothetical protein